LSKLKVVLDKSLPAKKSVKKIGTNIRVLPSNCITNTTLYRKYTNWIERTALLAWDKQLTTSTPSHMELLADISNSVCLAVIFIVPFLCQYTVRSLMRVSEDKSYIQNRLYSNDEILQLFGVLK